MKYIVYLTTNKQNNKIYVGVHKTQNPEIFDGYIGCGVNINSPKSYKRPSTPFQYAVNKYGINNFFRHTLYIFDTEPEALKKESDIVNEDFIKRIDTYNISLGGGMPPDLSKEIFQFDITGNFIKSWKNQIEIVNNYNCYSDMIYNCIKDKRSFNDYYWSHSSIININEYRLSRTKCIYHYNSDGFLLNIFDNIRDTSNKLDIDKNQIINAIAQKSSINGCYFLTALTSITEVLEFRKNKNGGKKKVYRYKLDGNFDKEYNSLADAAKDCGLKKSHSISTAIKNFSTSANYKWSFNKLDIYQKVNISYEVEQKRVGAFDDALLIEEFENVSACIKKYPYCRRVLRGERAKAHNLIFKYIS